MCDVCAHVVCVILADGPHVNYRRVRSKKDAENDAKRTDGRAVGERQCTTGAGGR